MKYYESNQQFKSEWHRSVFNISEKYWVEIFGKKCIKSTSFFRAIELSKMPNVEFHYLTITENAKVVVIVPCFFLKLDIIDVLGKSIIKFFLEKIRKRYSKFLKIKTFVIGSYASSCECFIGICKINKEKKAILSKLITENLKKKSKKLAAKLTVIKEIRETQIEEMKELFSDSFCFCKSYPNTFVPTFSDCMPYPSALKKNHRRRYKRITEKFEEQYMWEIVLDIAPYEKKIERLYLNVLQKAKNKFEVLNGSFFTQINKNLPDNTFFVLCRDVKNEIRAMALVVEEDDRLIPLYLGIDYREDDTRVFYINMLFKMIELSEQKKKLLVEFGQTSYYPKIMSGAFAESIYYGLSSYNKSLFKVLTKISRMDLFDINLMSNVYKKDKLDSIISRCENECNFKISKELL